MNIKSSVLFIRKHRFNKEEVKQEQAQGQIQEQAVDTTAVDTSVTE